MTAERRILFVTRDFERVNAPISLPDWASLYTIANARYDSTAPNFFGERAYFVQEDTLLDTARLLEHPQTVALIDSLDITDLVVFKPTKRIERIAKKLGIALLNPSAVLADTVEQKISQIEWLEDDADLLPEHEIACCKDIAFYGEPFILQFNRSHTGGGTHLITTEKELRAITKPFPNREARLVQYINGPMYTLNAVVTDDDVLCPNISYQITGIRPFTDIAFATVGNDWELPHAMLSLDEEEQLRDITKRIGYRLQRAGWRGLFGIDAILEEDTGIARLIEINARQPASATFESMIQGTHTTMSAHLLALLGAEIDQITPIHTGAQIVLRNQQALTFDTTRIKAHINPSYYVQAYRNSDHGTDLLRIQSLDHGLMKSHQECNADAKTLGKEILTFAT